MRVNGRRRRPPRPAVLNLSLPDPDRLADPGRARTWFLVVALATLAVRAAVAARLPITGDEAYFFYWGKWPAWGYYDHPPMVGWWLAPLARLGEHPFLVRLPALLVPPVLALLARASLARYGEALAWQAATLVLLAPLDAWNVAITTDVPLMLFAGVTVVLYLRAVRTGRPVDYLLAGFALAGALMSKYFAGLLALGILAHALWRADRRSLVGLACVVAGALPAAVVQIAWNAQHCWPNVMFNLVNRHENAGLSWRTPPLYLVTLAYVLIPYVAWRAWVLARRALYARGAADERPAASGDRAAGGDTPVRARGSRAAPGAGDARDAYVALAFLAGVPFALFLALSLVKTIGLHWLASFVMPALMAFALRDSARARAAALRFGAAFVLLHYAAIGVLAALPLETFRGLRAYDGIVLTLAPADLEAAMRPYLRAPDGSDFVLAADGFSPAATLGFDLGRYVVVFGPGSSHARHDDILTDWRRVDGANVLVVIKGRPPDMTHYAPYFERVETIPLTVRGAPFWLVRGYGFRYARYRDEVLELVRERWYQVPRWLPQGPCYFCDRYFPDRACHR